MASVRPSDESFCASHTVTSITSIAINTVLLTLIIAVRYVLIAWTTHALIWRKGRAGSAGTQLNRDWPRAATIRHELTLSVLSSWIYALPAAIGFEAWKHGGTAVYLDPLKYGLVWLVLSGFVYLVIQDAYYYWLHRLMHHPALFRWTHAGHHRSRQPTAFASFSFDWAEAALNAWLLPALAFVIPIHPAVILILLTLATIAAVLNHSGAEVLPPWMVRGPVGDWLITASHHSIHHNHYQKNFGLYFRFWDRVMKTDTM
jgi:sterol desaturase/sphingolipid hydroxylase (fatty acid hydroxylase superfamily)